MSTADGPGHPSPNWLMGLDSFCPMVLPPLEPFASSCTDDGDRDKEIETETETGGMGDDAEQT